MIGVEKTNEELIIDLLILNDVRIKGLKQNIRNAAIKCNVSITNNVPKLITKFWQGESKGILQVIWDRGFIDPSKLRKYYVMKGTR